MLTIYVSSLAILCKQIPLKLLLLFCFIRAVTITSIDTSNCYSFIILYSYNDDDDDDNDDNNGSGDDGIFLKRQF